MPWTVEPLNATVEKELLALPTDMQARFLHIAELLQTFGPHQVGMPHVRPLGNKLWEMRMRGRTGVGRAICGCLGAAVDCSACLREEDAEDAEAGARSGVGAPEGDGAMSDRFRALKERMLSDARVREDYDALGPEFELARELIAARARAGLTQSELAERMGTTQSAIARLESGRRFPSMRTLARYAEATGSRPVVKLEAAE